MSEEPKFDSINKNVFKIPEGYFESVTEKLMAQSLNQQVPSEPRPARKLFSSANKRIVSALGMAATVAALVFIFGPTSDVPSSLPMLDDQTILAYLDNHADGLELDALVDIMEMELSPEEINLIDTETTPINEALLDEIIEDYNLD